MKEKFIMVEDKERGEKWSENKPPYINYEQLIGFALNELNNRICKFLI